MKLDYKKTIVIGLAFLGLSAFWQLYDVLVPLLLENTFHLDKMITGTIMSLDNVLALFLLPFFGTLSDRVGKRMPFILIGTGVASLGLAVLPFAANADQFVWFNVTLGIVLLAMSIYRAPAIALMPDLTEKPLRSKANALINLMGAIGAILALVSIRVFVPKSDRPDYTLVFCVVALIMVVSVLVLRFRIDETRMRITDTNDGTQQVAQYMPKEVHRSLVFLLASIFLWFMAYNGVTTAFSRYAIAMWQMSEGSVATALMVSTVVAILTYIPSGIIATRIGRKFAVLFGIFLVSVTYGLGSLLTSYSVFIYVAFAIMGIGWAFINVNSLPMLLELGKSGDIGKYTGWYYVASMSAQILTPILSGVLMQYVGFHVLFPYAFVFSVLSYITMTQVRHGDSKEVVSSKLELFNDDIEV